MRVLPDVSNGVTYLKALPPLPSCLPTDSPEAEEFITGVGKEKAENHRSKRNNQVCFNVFQLLQWPATLFRYNFERFFESKNILIKGSSSTSNSNSSAVKGTRVCLMPSPKLIFLSNFFRVFGFQTFLISFVSFIAVSPSRNNCLTRLFTSPSSRSTYITHKRNPEVH